MNPFFGTTGLQHKLLILIKSSNIFNWKSVKKYKVDVVSGAKFESNYVQCCEKTKKLALSLGYFQIMHQEYIYVVNTFKEYI